MDVTLKTRAVLLTEIPRVISGDRRNTLNRNTILKIKIDHGLDGVEVLLIICVCDHGLIVAVGTDTGQLNYHLKCVTWGTPGLGSCDFATVGRGVNKQKSHSDFLIIKIVAVRV